MGAAGQKYTGTVLALGRGSIPVPDQNNSSPPRLPVLSKSDVKRACQLITLQMPVQKCADGQQATTRAVESQRQGESAMSLHAAANLSRSDARSRADFAKLLGFTGPMTDPDFMEATQTIAEYYWREQIKLMDPQPVIIEAHQHDLFGSGQ